MWSLFGVHAGLRLLAQTDLYPQWLPGDTAYADIDWVEAMYACLSWTAKLYVFWTSFAYVYDASQPDGGFDRDAGEKGTLSTHIGSIGAGVVMIAILSVMAAGQVEHTLSTPVALVIRMLPV